MGLLCKLVFRDFFRHRSMLGFAFLSIVAVCCLVVWFVASIDTASFSPDHVKGYYGKFTLALSTPAGTPVASEVFDALDEVEAQGKTTWIVCARQNPADLRLINFKESLKPSGMGDRKCPMLLGMASKTSPFEMEDGRWFRAPMECVIGDSGEKLLTAVAGKESGHRVAVGDRIRVKNRRGEFDLTVVGKLEQKPLKETSMATGRSAGASGTFAFGFGLGIGGGEMGGGQKPPASRGTAPAAPQTMRRPGGMFGAQAFGPATPSLYISYGDLCTISGDDETVNLIYVQLADGVSGDDFSALMEKKLGRGLRDFGIRISDTRPPKKSNDEMSMLRQANSTEAVISQAWSTIGIVILASVFIIFTTLSMGVTEKIRHLAMLRTIGLTRNQVALYIILEGLVLGLLGWIAGMAAGWGLLTGHLYVQTGSFPVVTLTFPCILLAFFCSIFGALIASIVPAWRATRVSPSESMVRRLHNLSGMQLTAAGVLGLLLLASIPMLVFGLPLSVKGRVLLFSTLGTGLLAAGFLLFFPWTILLTEKLLGPLVARILGFNPRFLANVLSGNQWRTLGTTIAMSIGLGLFTAIQIWSGSMLSMFTVPDTVPNVLVRFQEGVISGHTTEQVGKFPGIVPGCLMRLSVAQPGLDPVLQRKMREAKAMGDNVVVFGVDAGTAYREKDPLLRLRFVEGSREETYRAFKVPGARVCVIPETLSVHGNLHKGDKLLLKKSSVRDREQRGMPRAVSDSADPQFNPADYAEYTVAGVVDFAWVWLSKCSGVRVSSGRTAGCIFTPYEPVLTDFGAPDREFFWFDVQPGVEYQTIVDYMRTAAADSAEQNQASARRAESFSGGTRWDSGINKNYVQVSSIESLNNSLNSRASGVISAMTRMPLIILILSTIAVLNTMVVSVRARRWEMGVFRACGVTRSGLIRIILAESLLIGLCACVMSFSFGLFYAWMATRMIEFAPVFGVIAPALIVEWGKLAFGFAIAIGVCIAAGIYPAFSTGLRETSQLLQHKE